VKFGIVHHLRCAYYALHSFRFIFDGPVGEINWFGPNARNSLELWLSHAKFAGKFSSKPSQNVMGGGFWWHEESWTYSGDTKVTTQLKEDKLTDFRCDVMQLSFVSERKAQEAIEEKCYFIGWKEGHVNDHGSSLEYRFSRATITNFSHVHKLLSMAKKPVSCRKSSLVLIQIFFKVH
jgi:hypothetical protein